MNHLTILIIMTLANASTLYAQSNLLKSVKQNSNQALVLCEKFRSLNAKGISASSADVIANLSKEQNLTIQDAEILSMYVIGLYCPEVN